MLHHFKNNQNNNIIKLNQKYDDNTQTIQEKYDYNTQTIQKNKRLALDFVEENYDNTQTIQEKYDYNTQTIQKNKRLALDFVEENYDNTQTIQEKYDDNTQTIQKNKRLALDFVEENYDKQIQQLENHLLYQNNIKDNMIQDLQKQIDKKDYYIREQYKKYTLLEKESTQQYIKNQNIVSMLQNKHNILLKNRLQKKDKYYQIKMQENNNYLQVIHLYLQRQLDAKINLINELNQKNQALMLLLKEKDQHIRNLQMNNLQNISIDDNMVGYNSFAQDLNLYYISDTKLNQINDDHDITHFNNSIWCNQYTKI